MYVACVRVCGEVIGRCCLVTQTHSVVSVVEAMTCYIMIFINMFSIQDHDTLYKIFRYMYRVSNLCI